MKYTYNGIESVIIYNKDITDYYTQPFADMYNDLSAIKKDEYTNERIVVTAYGTTDEGIWKHFFNIVKTIDIPIFFITVKTNCTYTKKLVEKLCVKIIPYETIIQVTIDSTNIKQTPINDKFDYSEHMCLNPFMNLEIAVNGNITSCCEIDKRSNQLPPMPNIKNTTLEQAVKSDYVQKVRQDFLQGHKPSYCNTCWKKEAKGITSKRQRDQYYFKELLYTTEYKNKTDLTALDIKLGFSCNLKCRICDHLSSSTWYAEEKKFKTVPALEEIDYGFTLSKDFWIDQIDNLQNVKYLTFAGGEPMLDKTHIHLLQKLVDTGRTDIFIHYNTNGTQYSQNLIQVLNNFDKVGISFSIDNVREKFDYERNGSNWNVVADNIQKFSQLDRTRYVIDLYPTVSIFNILDLDSVLDICTKYNFGYELNFVDNPKQFSLYNIPLRSRDQIIKHLSHSKYDIVKTIIPKLQENTYYNLNNKFWAEVDKIDIRRNQDFKHTYPDVAKIMSDVCNQTLRHQST